MEQVRYTNPENGFPGDRHMARLYLEVGKTYTLTRTVVHSWSTDFYIHEFPGVPFNSVLFEAVNGV